MTVGYGNTDALGGDKRSIGIDNYAILYLTPDLEGFLLALLLLATDEGDDVVDHLGPLRESLARAGNCLICGGNHLIKTELEKGGEHGNVGLNGAVGLNRDKSALGAETFLLGLDNCKVIRVDLGHKHRNVLDAAASGVVGYNGKLVASKVLLHLANLSLGHINRAENEITEGCDSVNLCGIKNLHIRKLCGHRLGKLPTAADSLSVCLARASCRSGKAGNFKIGVICKQGEKTLTNHTGRADYTAFLLFGNNKTHNISPFGLVSKNNN